MLNSNRIKNIFSSFAYKIGQVLIRPYDISCELRRLATKQSAEYVAKNMSSALQLGSDLEVHKLALEKSEIDGLVLEFGVFSGRTINFISENVEKVYGFDSFEGLPEDWRPGVLKGHFARADVPNVNNNVELVIGWFDESLPKFVNGLTDTDKVKYLHIDCDLYSSTKTVLSLLEKFIVPGTVVVFDEYMNYPGWKDGEYKAFMEFCENQKIEYDYIAYNSRHEQVAVMITKQN